MAVLVEVVVIAVYGGSALVAVGAGVAWRLSHRFRESLVGDENAR